MSSIILEPAHGQAMTQTLEKVRNRSLPPSDWLAQCIELEQRPAEPDPPKTLASDAVDVFMLIPREQGPLLSAQSRGNGS
jgi:hypothetical protein